jgi:hypothetical protein
VEVDEEMRASAEVFGVDERTSNMVNGCTKVKYARAKKNKVDGWTIVKTKKNFVVCW